MAAMAAACSVHAAEPVRIVAPRRRRVLAPLVAVSAIMLSLGVGLGWAVASHRDTVALWPTTSSNVVADR